MRAYDAAVAITSEARKRLWGRSGNCCAKCRQELVRSDVGDLRGALVGEEAHIIAKSPGGARYTSLEPKVRDGYDNLILLCANDHTEVDAQPGHYTEERLRSLKHLHELWVRSRLHVGSPVGVQKGAVATVMRCGDDLWTLFGGALGWQVGMPEGLTDEEEDLIDSAVQTFTDWCDISSEVEVQSFRAMRDAKRSLTSELNELAQAGFLVLAGQRQAAFAGGGLIGLCLVLEVVRPEQLEALRVPPPEPKR